MTETGWCQISMSDLALGEVGFQLNSPHLELGSAPSIAVKYCTGPPNASKMASVMRSVSSRKFSGCKASWLCKICPRTGAPPGVAGPAASRGSLEVAFVSSGLSSVSALASKLAAMMAGKA